METKLLEDLGLTNSEIIVYSKLLNMGIIKASILINELSLHRSRIYEALNNLIKKGLVSYIIKNKIKLFSATDPERLLNYIDEQKEKLNEKQKNLKKLIPELKKQAPTFLPNAEAHIFYGKEGFKTMRQDVLKQKQTLYLIGGKGKEDKTLEYFFPNFNRLRIKNKIKWKIIYDFETKGKEITKLKLMQTRFLPKEYSSPCVINIYGDRIVNVLWQNNNPICFMIINQGIADSYRKWFDLIWRFSSH